MRTTREGRGDDGFTLPELLISMVILSFIVGAIGFALTVVLRNTRATAERSVGNLGAQALSAWFTGDVESAAVDGFRTAPEAVTGCPGTDPGVNVLRMARADGLMVVSYRVVQSDTEYDLWRVICADGNRIHNVVVQSITAPTDVGVTPETIDETTTPGSVSLRVTTGTVTPATVTVTGTPRTRDVPTPCSVVSGTPQSLPLTGGHLLTPAVFSVHLLGGCGAITLEVPTLGTPAMLSVPMTLIAGTTNGYVGQVAAGAATWGAGTRSVTVRSGAADAGRFPVLVSDQPCTVTSATPTSFEYRPLGPPISYRVFTSGPCTSLSLSIPSGGNPALLTPTLTQVAPTEWNASVPGDHITWTAGRKVVTVVRAGQSIGTLALQATPAPCRLVSGNTAVPPRTDASGQLTGNLGVTVATFGVCGRIGLSIPTGGLPRDPFVVSSLAPGAGPVTWTTTLPRPGQTWTPGLRDATVTNDDQFLGTFPFDLREVCSMIGNGPSSIAVGSDLRLLAATTFTVRTRGTCGTVTLRIPTGGSPGTLNRTLTPSGADYTTIVQPADATWATGTLRTLAAANDGAPLGSWDVNVTQPCTVVAGPKQIRVTATSPKRVTTDATVAITTSGACPQPLSVRFPTGVPSPDPLPVALTLSGAPDTWNGVIHPADAAWTTEIDTPRTARVYSGTTEVGSFLYVVTDCSLVSSRATVALQGNRVAGGERLQYRTTGSACRSTMTVQFTPPGTTVQTEQTTPVPAPDWQTRTLGGLRWNNGQGPVTVSVYNSDILFDASTLVGTYTVQGA